MSASSPATLLGLDAFSPDELVAEAIDAPRTAFVPVPGQRVIQRPGWSQLLTPSIKDGGLNGVSHAQLTDTEADRVIDATVAEYAAHGCRFRWAVTPGSTPADLDARLAARGMSMTACHAMVGATRDVPTSMAEDITVEVIEREAALPDFIATMAAGWRMNPAALWEYQRAALADPRQRQYLARFRGEPVAVAGDVAFARSLYLLGAVVLPAARGRGVYRALIAARAARAGALGLPLLATQAHAMTSAPILARLGFATAAIFPVYSWAPPST